MITFKAQHILNPAAKKRTFWRIFKPKLQANNSLRPNQYDHFQVSTYTKPCGQKTDILAKVYATITANNNSQETLPI